MRREVGGGKEERREAYENPNDGVVVWIRGIVR